MIEHASVFDHFVGSLAFCEELIYQPLEVFQAEDVDAEAAMLNPYEFTRLLGVMLRGQVRGRVVSKP